MTEQQPQPRTVIPVEPVAVDIETARQLVGGISRQTMYNLINSGKVRTKHIGRRRVVVVKSLREWAENET